MNLIPIVQNQPDHILLLRARQQTYSYAKNLLLCRLFFAVVFPIAAGSAVILGWDLEKYVATLALVLVVAESAWLEPEGQKYVKRASNISEQFDVSVLLLPWDDFTVGARISAEDIHSAAKDFSNESSDSELRDWYPRVVGELPLHLAGIICQRINLRYELRLRHIYCAIIRWALIIFFTSILFLSLSQDFSLEKWILTMIPSLPFMQWAFPEYRRQMDAANSSESLAREADKLWADALGTKCDTEQCCIRSREFQTAMYNRRVNGPLLFPFLYWFFRPSLEEETEYGAESMVQAYRKTAEADARAGSTVKE